MKSVSWNHTRALLICSAVSTLSFGSGFQINEQSARSIGQAFSGRVSDADSASTIATNPAGLSHLTRPEISGGLAYIDAKSDISDASASNSLTGPVTGTNDGDMIPSITIPFIYYAQPIDDRWSAGVGIYVPFGLETEYEDGFQGRYLGTNSEVTIVTIQPTVSLKITPQLSFGLGITYNKADGKLERNSIGFIPPGTVLPNVEATVEGDDTAWGYNAGLLYELNDNTRFGLTYYSKVDYKLEGDTTIRNFGPTQKFDASLDITTPERVEFGVTHNLTQQLTLHANAGRTSWRKLEEIVVENDTSNPLLARSVEELDWEDSWLYAVGLSYAINPQWTVRGGIAYDESPVPDSTRSVRVPVGDRVEYAMGLTWTPIENLSIDAAYLYFKERDSDVNTTQANGPISYSYAAKYDNSANVFGLQLTYRM